MPLATEAREQLWLDDPAQWLHLADAAEAWAFRRVLDGTSLQSREELAATWWAQEVVPAVERIRAAGEGVGLRDIQLYAQASQEAADHLRARGNPRSAGGGRLTWVQGAARPADARPPDARPADAAEGPRPPGGERGPDLHLRGSGGRI